MRPTPTSAIILLSFVVSLVSSASQLTCGEVKSLYNEAQCCGSDPSEPAKTTTSFCYPVRDFGYPKCYATFLDLSKQYADDTQWAYLPSEEGYSYHPYSGALLSDCINIPRAVRHTVPHSSPLGTAILSVAKDPSLPVRLDGQLAISLTARGLGTEQTEQRQVINGTSSSCKSTCPRGMWSVQREVSFSTAAQSCILDGTATPSPKSTAHPTSTRRLEGRSLLQNRTRRQHLRSKCSTAYST